jgi:general secretion pathway protein D
MPNFERAVLPALIGIALGGCSSLQMPAGFSGYTQPAAPAATRALAGVRLDNVLKNADSNDRKVVIEGVKALKEGRLEQASKIFNVALKLNVTSSEIHLLNALTYHLMALAGDTGKFEMAEEGFRVALRFDPANWLADYQIGLCYLDQRKYALAQAHLASAATTERNNPDLLFDLAVASYYAGDPRVAEGALKRLRDIAPERAHRPDVLRAAVMTQAALNDGAGVRKTLAEFRTTAAEPDVLMLERRTEDWGQFYRTAVNDGPTILAQSLFGGGVPPVPAGGGFPQSGGFPQQGGIPQPGGFPQQGGGFPQQGAFPQQGGGQAGFGQQGAPAGFVDDKMVVVDVVLISTLEDANESYGINLLNGLRLQFGDPQTNTPAFSRSTNGVNSAIDPSLNVQTQTITRSLRIPSISYSLNIANALNDRDEVIAKPSLVALAGQTSDFFSGSEIQAAAVSGGAGDSVSIKQEVGVKLAVRPDFLPDGKVRLQIAAQRTFLTSPSSSVVFQFRLDTSKTNVNANVVLRFGETLVLSGLTESENTSINDGVPVLRDIPGVNLLFSQHSRTQYRKSVLILLTPRRPIYGAQSAEDRKAGLDSMNEYERSLSQLEGRNADWFRPRSIADEVREQLNRNNSFMREFRLGDVRSERWDKRESHGRQIEQTISRLFI